MTTNYSVISLFSGAMGLDLGLEQAGFCPRVAVESNRFAVETIEINRPSLPVISRPIEDVSTDEILGRANLNVGEATVVAAGPCCQAFSTVGQRGSLKDPRGVMFREFLRVVRDAQPRFFVMENVRGILSAAIRHRPLNQRGPGYPPLRRDEELGSAFRLIVGELRDLGYFTVFGVLNSADYGTAQIRERVIFLGSRDGESVRMPEPSHDAKQMNGFPVWRTLRQTLRGLREREREYRPLTLRDRRYLKRIPEGGNWRDLPIRMQFNALGGAAQSWGGRTGFLRRLSWDRPSPSLPTQPDSRATMLCHPTELRPLSIQEYARIQQFPDDWWLAGSLAQRYRQVGNAVPVGLGAAVGGALRKTMRSRRRIDAFGEVAFADAELMRRMASRPRTMLNPPRMRKIKQAEAIAGWRNGRERLQSDFLSYPVVDVQGIPVVTMAEDKVEC